MEFFSPLIRRERGENFSLPPLRGGRIDFSPPPDCKGEGEGGADREILIRAKVDFMFNRRGGEGNFGALQERSIGYSGISVGSGGEGEGEQPNGRRRRPEKKIIEYKDCQ